MKSIFKITAVAAVLACTQTASAGTNIYITGSTAFRGAVANAIVALMGGDANVKIAQAGSAQTSASFTGSNDFIVGGTLNGVTGSVVFCHFTGSTQGITDVAHTNGLPFIPASALPASNGVANSAVSQTASGSHAADIAFSDVFQSASTSLTPSLTDTKVAVIPFVWVANRGTTGISNVTAQQARAVLTAGYQAKSLFTGDATAADATSYVMHVGRDDGSGTRATMMAETKYGIFNAVKQMKVTTSGTAGTTATVTSAQLWPIDGTSTLNLAGNGGYSSGSFIKAIMGATSIPSGAYTGVEFYDETGADQGNVGQVTFIACLGASDSSGAINSNGAVKLNYEGVDYWNGTSAAVATQVYNGLYTMWGYEHIFTNGTPAGELATFITNMGSQFDNTTILGANGLRLSQMTVNRQYDGAVVGP